MRKTCSSDREKPLKFSTFSLEFEKILRSQEQFIQTVKGNNRMLLTCSWRFLISNKLEVLELRLNELLGFRNMQGKLENKFSYCSMKENAKVCSLASLNIKQTFASHCTNSRTFSQFCMRQKVYFHRYW